MTKLIEYQCNFCRDKKKYAEVVGMHWKRADDLDTRNPNDAENHLCLICIREIGKIRDEMEDEELKGK